MFLDFHLPYMGRNTSISWRKLGDFVGNLMFSLEKENKSKQQKSHRSVLF